MKNQNYHLRSNSQPKILITEILQASNDGFWDWNIQTGEVYFSQQWSGMLGYLPGEIPPHVSSWEKLVHPDDMPNVMKVLTKHLNMESDYYETEHRVKCKDGTWKWILDRGRVIERLKDGTPIRAFGAHTDITEKKLLEQEIKRNLEKEIKSKKEIEKLNSELTKALELRNNFLSVASHELKTPLTSIFLIVQSSKRNIEIHSNEETLSKILRSLELTENQLHRIAKLIDDMLEISRIEAGKFIFNFEEFEMCNLINEVIDRMNPLAVLETGKVIEKNNFKNAKVKWDKSKIDQVLTNLISNALRYGLKNPIKITVEDLGHQIKISVLDKGIGIHESDKDKIFELFERGENTKEIRGLGLGLFITRQIVDHHKGQIFLESEIGKGSIFSIILPKIVSE